MALVCVCSVFGAPELCDLCGSKTGVTMLVGTAAALGIGVRFGIFSSFSFGSFTGASVTGASGAGVTSFTGSEGFSSTIGSLDVSWGGLAA